MPHFRAVVFDMDGLMFNTEEVYTSVGSELMRRRGKTFTAGLKDAMMGLPPKESFEMMIRWHDLSDTAEELIPESNAIFLELLREQLAMMPGLDELLEALEAAGIPKAIATSSCRELTGACLTPFDLARRFAFVLTSEDIVRGKPDPEVYLAAAARFGVQPAGDAGVGGQPERLPGGRSGRGVHGGRAGRAQPATGLQRGFAGGRKSCRRPALRGVGHFPAKRRPGREKTRLDAGSKKPYSPRLLSLTGRRMRRPARLRKGNTDPRGWVRTWEFRDDVTPADREAFGHSHGSKWPASDLPRALDAAVPRGRWRSMSVQSLPEK